MSFYPKTVQEIADHVGGEVVGDGSIPIQRIRGLDEAGPGDLSFLANSRYSGKLASTKASAVIAGPRVAAPGLTLVRHPNPYLAFAKALDWMAVRPTPPQPGVHPGAFLHPGATLEEGAALMTGSYVGEGAVIGGGSVLYPGAVVLAGAVVGRDCVLYPQVVVREGCRLGDRVILQAGAMVGSDGFGFAPDGPRYYKIPQMAPVIVEDDVEIGSCSTVDRGALEPTFIGRGTKIDNLVQIGHGCRIGANSLIVAQCGVAGSTTLGEHTTLAGRTGVAGHLILGADTLVYSTSAVVKSFPQPGNKLSGNPARPHRESLRQSAQLARLEKLTSKINDLQKRIDAQQDELDRLKGSASGK